MSRREERTLLVTGASGHLGRRVVELLLDARAGRVVAGTRKPEALADLAARGAVVRQLDLDAPGSLVDAFVGVDRLLLVSTDSMEPGRRLEQHRRAIDAAKRAGVKHVVYTSFSHPEPGTPIAIDADHWGTEQALAESGLSYTSLRNNIYAENLLWTMPRAVATGKLVAAAGEGGAAYVTREDCARVAATVLASSTTGATTLEITGPSVVSYAELARLLTEVTGRTVTHVPVDAAALRTHLVAGGLPDFFAEALVSFDLAMDKGLFGPLTNEVAGLTGTAPTNLRDFLAANRESLLAQS